MNALRTWNSLRHLRSVYLEQVRNAGSDPMQKVQFHAKMLDEYFLRFLGFVRLGSEIKKSFLDGSLFLVVEASTQVADADIRPFDGSDKQSVYTTWMQYKSSLAALRNSKCIKEDAEEIYRKLTFFSQAVAMSKMIEGCDQ